MAKKKKDKELVTTASTLDAARKAIRKKYGDVVGVMGDKDELVIDTISTGSLSLDAALGRGGFAMGRVYEIYGMPSGGKCQSEDTYLFTEYGLLTIKELFELKGTPTFITQKEVDCVCGLINEYGEMENTSHFVWNGKRSVRKIITNAGFEVESTYNHKYRVIDQDTGFIVWKKTEDITTDDYLLLNRYGNDYVKHDEINEDEATFLGMLIAEGSLNYKNRVSFTNKDKTIVKLFSDLCDKLFNYTVKHYTKTSSGNISLEEANGVIETHIDSKKIRQCLYDNYDLDYVVASGKNVPIKVRKSSNMIVAKFLSAYFSLDGCYENDGSITASSASKELLLQIQLLLLNNFGIKSTVNSKHNKEYDRDYYHLYLGCEDVVLFMKHINFILQDKVNKFNKLNIDYDVVSRNTLRWNFPYQNNLLRCLCKDVEGDRLSNSIINKQISHDRNQKLSQTKISEILEYFKKLFPGDTANLIIEHLKKLQNYICDRVISVEDVGEKAVFDVVMPKTHSFISNGLISHNTTLAMSIIAQAQKRDLRCVFVDVEHSADPQLFKAMGVNLDNLMTISAFIGDDNLDALETLIKTNEIDVAVVDSVSALIPSAEAAAEIGDDFMGLLARLMSKAMRRLTPIVSETETLLIFVNQIRYKIGSWGDPTTTTGGEALNFYSTGRIAVAGGEFKKSLITDPITSEVVGHNTSFHIRKNKLAPPFRSAEVPLIYGKGYDVEWEALKLAESMGIIEKNGAWYYHNKEKIAQGELNARDYLKKNKDVYEEIRIELIDLMGLKGAYERHSK